ncbi:MAG: pyruvate kinase [Candidatus Omnitrophica bacterium]|nr:pyruvate kinase [Candidatus Omnitrophota bacterium]
MTKVKTQIICTLGPSSESAAVLRKMILAGMDVARLNFSHGTHKDHLEKMKLIRSLNSKYRRHIKILQDLEGFRIRIGSLKNFASRCVPLKKNQIVYLTNDESYHSKSAIPFDYDGSLKDIKPESHMYIEDGNIVLLIKKCTKKVLTAKTIVPGIIKENKGINIPDVKLKFKGMTDKDVFDLEFGLKHDVDFVAQSFIRNKQDILNVRDIVNHHKKKCLIIAKIENRQGVDNIDEIIDASDGIMVARGDMGVCFPIYEVPVLQKVIIRKCRAKRKFVITATQMLESMTSHIRPTRAEATDVANAIIDGTNYTMLSEETAAGKYPVEAVTTMNEICKFTEQAIAKKVI